MTNDANTSRYSDKLESLLTFLEENCGEHKNDNGDDCDVGGRKGGVLSPPTSSRAGLADITNCSSPPTAEGKKNVTRKDAEDIQGLPPDRVDAPSKPLVIREKKKYVWDDWEEASLLNSLDALCDKDLLDDPKPMPPGDNAEESATCKSSSNGLPANARQQLRDLQSMSEEIQTRAAAMKVEMEQKKKVVEELHSIRVKNEAEHVQKMKAVKNEWKKRLDGAKAEHDRAMAEQTKQKATLEKDCAELEQKLRSIQADIEKTTKSEQDTCERLKRDAVQDLEESKRSWLNAEKEESKRRDQKISPKLKRDAAKAVEPKLRLLMERNKEEIERLEREAARELDCFQLKLYKMANEAYKNECNTIRNEERKRVEKLEIDFIANSECLRKEHEAEMKRVRAEHEQRQKFMAQQFKADEQKCNDEHAVAIEEAERAVALEMEQISAQHEREMRELEEDYAEKMAQKQKLCEE